MSGLRIVFLGLSITSAWGNGHATTYRALVRGLAGRGHQVLFLERDVDWYASHRDLPEPPWGRTALYRDLGDLDRRFRRALQADAVIIGSFVPEGIQVSEWVLQHATGMVAFYDIDTPVTLASLERGDCDYLTRALIPEFDVYLSFAGGPALRRLRDTFGARRAHPLYCSVDPVLYRPMPGQPVDLDLGYLGTWSADRQPALDRLLLQPALRWPAGRFCVAGAQYPPELRWPGNVRRVEHLPPDRHRRFYNAQRFTLNVTRGHMVANGYSPSVRLFEAAACGVPIITDPWAGLEEFFTPGEEILVAHSADDTLALLRNLDRATARNIGRQARERVLGAHTADRRAAQLERCLRETTTASLAAREAC